MKQQGEIDPTEGLAGGLSRFQIAHSLGLARDIAPLSAKAVHEGLQLLSEIQALREENEKLKGALKWLEQWFRDNHERGGNHACPWCYMHADGSNGEEAPWSEIKHSPDCIIGAALSGLKEANTDHVEAHIKKELSDSMRLAESGLAAEKLGGNVVKAEYWKGELAAVHRMRIIVSTRSNANQPALPVNKEEESQAWPCCLELVSFREEVQALRADKARLDWLALNPQKFIAEYENGNWLFMHRLRLDWSETFGTLRDCIDDALSSENPEPKETQTQTVGSPNV